MPTNLMWINEVNYITDTDQEFVEIAIPVDSGFRQGFALEIYAPDGSLLGTSLPEAASTTATDGINYIAVTGVALPDTGFAVALVDANGSVRDFLSFGLGSTTVTATEGSAEGDTSEAVLPEDTASRSVHLTGQAAGPTGWNWQRARPADVSPGARNDSQKIFLSKTTEERDVAVGDTGSDVINGLGGNDALFGFAGNDTLNGGEDNDALNGGSGADELNGGNGRDTATYISSNGGVDISTLLDGTIIGTFGDAAGDTYSSIEVFRLTDFTDSVNFTDALQAVRVNAEAGDDFVIGSDYDDDLDGRQGNDVLQGLDGNDTLTTGSGIDVVVGGAGDDRIELGTDGNVDTVAYLNGVDEGSDRIVRYEVGVDEIDLGGNAITSFAEAGGDTIVTLDTGTEITFADTAYADITFINGTVPPPPPPPSISGEELTGDDILDDNLKGTNLDDVIRGRGGNDTLIAGKGADTLAGGAGDDKIVLNNDGDVDVIVFNNTDQGRDTIWRYEIGVDVIDLRSGVQVDSWVDNGNRVIVTLDSGTEIVFASGQVAYDFSDIVFV